MGRIEIELKIDDFFSFRELGLNKNSSKFEKQRAYTAFVPMNK